jgi:hypothetical protein
MDTPPERLTSEPKRGRPMLAFALPMHLQLIACQVVEAPFSQSFSAENIDILQMEVEKGDISYRGADVGVFDLNGRNWGRAGSEEKASERQEGNQWASEVTDETLSIWSRSHSNGAGIDFGIGGPVLMDTVFYTDAGSVSLTDLAGTHYIEATGASLDYVLGSTTVYAGSGGVSGDLVPAHGDSIYISSEGDVSISLPFGLDYDLQVWGDAEHTVAVQDMGFYNTMQAGAYFAGLTGTGQTRVVVDVRGGDVSINAVCWDDCPTNW